MINKLCFKIALRNIREKRKLRSILKEVREFVEKRKDTQIYFKGTFKDNGIDRQFLIEQYDDILEILDKENKE